MDIFEYIRCHVVWQLVLALVFWVIWATLKLLQLEESLNSLIKSLNSLRYTVNHNAEVYNDARELVGKKIRKLEKNGRKNDN